MLFAFRLLLTVMHGEEDTDASIDVAVLCCNFRQETTWQISKHTYGQILNYKPVPIFFKSCKSSYSYFLFFLFYLTSPAWQLLEAPSNFNGLPSLQHHGLNTENCIRYLHDSFYRRVIGMQKGRQRKVLAAGQVPDTLRYAIPFHLNSSRRLVFLFLFVEQNIKTQKGEAISLQSYHQ